MKNNLTTIILAAGKGSRMLSNIPKWAHTIGNFTLLEHVIQKAKNIDSNEIIGVFAPNEVPTFDKESLITVAIQEKAKGTAHAALSAKEQVSNVNGVALILYADTPLIPESTLKKALEHIYSGKSQVSLIGFNETGPNSYGRLVTKGDRLLDIIETKDNPNITNITLCNSGIIAVDLKILWDLLSRVDDKNIYNEYYLTSIISIANSLGYTCSYVLEDNVDLTQGINTKTELVKLESTFQNLKRKEFLNKGVYILDPNTVFFSLDTKIGNNVTIYPYNIIKRGVTIEDNVTVESFCVLHHSLIKRGASIGPFARLAKDVTVGEDTQIGNFVELRHADIQNNVKIKHLSYIGDTDIGDNTNIGAGTITCNYDGCKKNHTTIEKNSFVGSNVSLVAPVCVGENSFIGAGSVITKDVSANSLALERSRQVEISGWSGRRKKR